MSKPIVLCVDDEEAILDGLRVGLRKRFRIVPATSGAEALDIVDAAIRGDRDPIEAVVSDMRMPGMNGAEVLTGVLERSPSTPRILLSGQADLPSTIDAINRAKVFRFLTKPCEASDLGDTLDEALELARLKQVERELLDQTLRGTVEMLTDVLGLVSPVAYGRTMRIRELVDQLCAAISRPLPWDLGIAALVSQVGCVVTQDDADAASNHVDLAADLLANIPRLESVASLVRSQADAALEQPSGPVDAWPDHRLDAEILRVAVAFEALLDAGHHRAEAVRMLRESGDGPVELVEALAGAEPATDALVEAKVTLDELATGMQLLDDLRATSGPMLAGAGTTLGPVLIQRIRSFARTRGVVEPIPVLAPRRTISRLRAAG